jgi:hypothetical protein
MAKAKKRAVAREEVLCYRMGACQSTVRTHYLRWRQAQNPPLPVRCDNRNCYFHTEPLFWNGMPLKPILDHVDGVNSDNRPERLQLLCPNCDSQLPTRGGANRGRAKQWAGGFAKVGKGGARAYVLPADRPGKYTLTGGEVNFTVRRASTSESAPEEPPAKPKKGK